MKLLQGVGLTNDQNVFWACRDEKNFGDWIGPHLFEKLSGKEPIYCFPHFGTLSSIYFTVGSILHYVKKPNMAVVWGSGIIDSQSTFMRPKKIHAVRGPLTRIRCQELGYKCPPIYGDPALLMPLFDTEEIAIKYELGIVPHMVDFDVVTKRYHGQGVKIVDVREDYNKVIANIRQCNCIASSSLHGIIIAHAYGIPAVNLPFSNKLVGDGVKFADYYGSFDIPLSKDEFTVSPDNNIPELIEIISSTALPNVGLVQEQLLASCPFRSLG